MTESKIEQNTHNVYGENIASEQMDRASRLVAEYGVDTMRNLGSLSVLIIGLKGVGVETAKNLIQIGPANVTVYDDDIVQIADLGTNFYLKPSHVSNCSRSEACTETLSELNPYCQVTSKSGNLTDEFIQSFGAVVITQTLPQKELIRINQLCRTRSNKDGKLTPSVFILAVTHGITGHLFSDFGESHIVTDLDGEPARVLVIDDISDDGVVTVAAKRHGFDDGDMILIEDIEGLSDDKKSDNYIENLNNLKNVKIERIYKKYDYKRPDGKIEKRNKQIFEKFRLDLSTTEFNGKKLTKWKTGGLINEIKPKKEYKFRSFNDTLIIPATDGLSAHFGPQHPDQCAWEQGVGKTIHLLYLTALEFNNKNEFFPRLHNENDSREFLKIFKEINKNNYKLQEYFSNYSSLSDEEKKENDCEQINKGLNGPCFVAENEIDLKRINGYSWYFTTELTGYCSFLGGIAAQEVIKKFGKYTPIYQWLHCDHIQLIGTEIASDAIPQSCRYDHQISIFGKSFQRKLGDQNIFLVGVGALGCEYLKGLAMMGVCCGSNGKLICTDMDRIEISNLSRQFLFRSHHVGKPKSIIAATVVKEMNTSFNIQPLEIKVWHETEDTFDDIFWDKLDLCWNALDNINARKYTDNKCLLHSKPLLESGTQGTKCNSEIILPYKTKSYNDGEEQETEGIAMCTLRNFPYLPLHCIEWARDKFSKFESQPKLFNIFIANTNKFLKQLDTFKGEEKYQMIKMMDKFFGINLNNLYNECIKLSFDDFVYQHITRIKDLIYLFPENANTLDGNSKFWSGHKKFPNVPKFDLNDDNINDYLYSSSQLYAFGFNIPLLEQPKNRNEFRKKAQLLNLKVPEWKEPIGLKIQVNEDDEKEQEDEKDNELKEDEINMLFEKFKKLDKTKLLKEMKETEFEKDNDKNFHIDYITAVTNARSRNYKIKETSRIQCKIVAGKIIAALPTTTAMICGLVELEFYKLKMGLQYVQQNAFYNANINLGVSQFQFFQPDAAICAQKGEVFNVSQQENEKQVPYPPNFTSWDSLIIDTGKSLTIGEFIKQFPILFNGITVDQLHKKFEGKGEKGIMLYNHGQHYKDKKVLNAVLIDKYIKSYGKLTSDKRRYVILDGLFFTKEGDVALLPRIKYYFK